jgi:hypothetical protein
MPKFALIVLTEPVAGREDEYHDWYNDQHLGDILAIEGFDAAQRFEFVETPLSQGAPHPFFAVYEVDAESIEIAEQRLLEALATAPRTDATSPNRALWWVKPLTERRVAG